MFANDARALEEADEIARRNKRLVEDLRLLIRRDAWLAALGRLPRGSGAARFEVQSFTYMDDPEIAEYFRQALENAATARRELAPAPTSRKIFGIWGLQ